MRSSDDIRQSMIDILESASAIVEEDIVYYQKIQDNWQKTIDNRKQREKEVDKKYNDNNFLNNFGII